MSMGIWYGFSPCVFLNSAHGVLFWLFFRSRICWYQMMCRFATSPVCIRRHSFLSSWWLVTILFWWSPVTATYQVPYFQTMIAFCPYVNALVRLMSISTTIAFTTCSCGSPNLLVIFHSSVRVPHFPYSSPDWLSSFCDISSSSLHLLSYFKSSFKFQVPLGP